METLTIIRTICMVLWIILMFIATVWSLTQDKMYNKMIEEILDKE